MHGEQRATEYADDDGANHVSREDTRIRAVSAVRRLGSTSCAFVQPLRCYRAAMIDRRAQLRELFYVDFPDELFDFWAWRQALDGEAERAFRDVLGISLRGAFDALAGKFDDRELRYPAVLHWRYQYDPPELFTVLTGNTDGLHWGYWFDDPGRLPPVVASYYASDAFELISDPTLFRAVASHLARTHRGTLENREHDRAHTAAYDRDLAALDSLLVRLPAIPTAPARAPTQRTAEGMGIVVAPQLVAPWQRPKQIDRAAILAFVDAELTAGRPGTALLVGKKLWDGEKSLAFEVLDAAYVALDREPLRRVAATHREHPALPSLDVLSYKRGDYSEVAEALAHPSDVRALTLRRVQTLDDRIGELTALEELALGGSRLTTLPMSLARCAALRTIKLYNNQLSALPAVLFELRALHTLTLGKNRLESADAITRCKTLVSLDLSANPIAQLPDDFGALTALTSLNLAGTKLTTLPASFAALEALEYLELSNCPLKQLPSDLARLRKLKRLGLVKTGLPAEEIERARRTLPATELVLSFR